MEFTLLEKSEQDAKGSIVVKAAISGDTTSYLLDEFYDALKSACGISRDVSQQDVEDTILQKLSKESYKELKRS